MMKALNSLGVPGLIIDLRQNGGGSGFLADESLQYQGSVTVIVGHYPTPAHLKIHTFGMKRPLLVQNPVFC
jgi:C-terminal processing protease CtpA/Prc